MRRAITHAALAVAIGCAIGGCGTATPAKDRVVPADAGPRVDQGMVAERTVDGMAPLACGFAPIDVLVAAPGIENAYTPEAKALRETFVLSAGGMSPQHPGGWVLMGQGGDVVTFGQREGALGIGATVGVARHGDSYRFENSGGCGPVGYPDGRRADPFSAIERGTDLEIHYTDGPPGSGVCDTPDGQVVVRESAKRVGLLLLQSAPPKQPGVICDLVGHDRVVTAHLKAPLGGRAVYDLGYLPARRVTVHPSGQSPSSS